MLIQKIKLEGVIPLRHKILRTGKPLASCYFDDDLNEGTFHLGAFNQEQIVGIATFIPNQLIGFQGNHTQLRGMAVDASQQGKGIGKALIHFSIALLKEKQVNLLWCNARIKASQFYAHLGFEQKGTTFDIPGVGMHFLMYKKL